MRYFATILIVFLLAACATTDQEKVSITGTKISKEELEEKSPILVISAEDIEGDKTVYELLTELIGFKGAIQEYKDCSDLLRKIKEKGITIKSISEDKVTTITETGAKLTYNVESGNCK